MVTALRVFIKKHAT